MTTKTMTITTMITKMMTPETITCTAHVIWFIKWLPLVKLFISLIFLVLPYQLHHRHLWPQSALEDDKCWGVHPQFVKATGASIIIFQNNKSQNKNGSKYNFTHTHIKYLRNETAKFILRRAGNLFDCLKRDTLYKSNWVFSAYIEP